MQKVEFDWYPLPRSFRTMAAELENSVLLETAKYDADNYRSFLFVEPLIRLSARTPAEVHDVFLKIDAHLQQDRFIAGFVSYECGEPLQGIAPAQQTPYESPLVEMGVFSFPLVFDHRTGTVEGEMSPRVITSGASHPRKASIHRAELQITPAAYRRQICRVQEYLAAGDSYQINLTDKVEGTFTGGSLDLYELLLSQQPVSYAAFLNGKDQRVLSLSPELFYRAEGGRLQVRPMKGTWPRGRNTVEDEEAALSLRSDEKNRAEHVTIVDLLRNDLGKVCSPGSVRVDALMQVERYRTVHQMTSAISGSLRADLSPTTVFRAVFPSGSVTGAPKRRTMQIIQEIERAKRGVYTGAIGYFGPQGEATFNVAIRTLLVKEPDFRLGVGGGITLDSTAEAEYDECLLKASFLTNTSPEFSLFETMLARDGVIPRMEAHMDRLRDSAFYFSFRFDEKETRRRLAERLRLVGASPTVMRLSLEADGGLQIETSLLLEAPWSGKVLLWPSSVNASDIFLQHKTSNRDFYRQALLAAQQQGFDEVIFQNQEGGITEGSISNLFVNLEGALFTPKMTCGLLPGIERAHVLSTCIVGELEVLLLSELRAAKEVWLSNALRGLRPVFQIYNAQGELIWGER